MPEQLKNAAQFENVSEAFSRQSTTFDAYEEKNHILKWMRRQIHKEVLHYLPSNAHLLELNCGTGIDAVFFASNGCRVHATDIAEGMLSETAAKIDRFHFQDMISTQKCSYTELENVSERNFDYVFSNFGGLNCIDDLSKVTTKLPPLLNPGAHVSFVLMAPVCPWEMALALKGNVSIGFRRLKKNGAPSHLEGVHFTSCYFSPEEAIKKFGNEFEFISLKGIASVSPPPYLDKFPEKYPKLYSRLCKWDEKVSHIWPFNHWADHYVLTMRYKGK